MRGWFALLSLIVFFAIPHVASAQPSPAELATARGLFREGVAAGNDGHWVSALDLFERAHALSGRADVLLNVAAAQVELGRLVAAAVTYRRFQVEADSAMMRQHGAAVVTALAELAARTPHVTVSTDPPGGAVTVILDGQMLAAAELGAEVPLDVGDHVAALLGGGAMLDSESFALAEREHRAIVLDAAVILAAAGSVASPPRSEDHGQQTLAPAPASRGGDDTLAIVLGVVAGVLLVGGAVTLGVVFGSPPAEAPSYEGTVFPYSIDVGP